ncbi:COG1470 family protein [Calothrix sp. 336/3]|uniref:COG1470 family protein n=1 Tax=Calothrix sp. 336/3 TaxID=1337936 RepID=UPI0004E460C9|nr:hypothetical protein [Calothrix sp. 336/3]AKG21656.1 hypothetical protein IJ00_10615 [Calothrix sp. 336/3]
MNPIKVIINPPGIQAAKPGDTIEMHMMVINQGDRSALIDVFLDEAFQIITQLSTVPSTRVVLKPQQSQEVSFKLAIPIDALPGTYDYNLVVNAPQDYPQHTPIQFRRQIHIHFPEQSVTKKHDPTFTLQPTTNPTIPLTCKPGEPLQVVITVNNYSQHIDKFRVTCLDLDPDWYTLHYPHIDLKVQAELANYPLEIKPNSQGKIWLEFHPPTDTFAGNYSPTLQVHSQNFPNLVLLDSVYIQIPAVYQLKMQLDTIQGKFTANQGKYQLQITNQGNTLRELFLSAKSTEETANCQYEIQPTQIRILPHRSSTISLTVQPTHSWYRSWLGGEQKINFQIHLQDAKEFPLTESLPQGSFIWKSRPFWQVTLLLFLILIVLGSTASFIWRILSPEPLKLAYLKSDNSQVNEGEIINLSWKIQNPNQLKKIVIITKGTVPNEKEYNFSQGIPQELNQGVCQQQNHTLTCSNFKPPATKPGKYTFELKAFSQNKNSVLTQSTAVEIIAKPVPEVISFQANNSQYLPGEQINLSWQIRHPEQLSQIQIITKQDIGTLALKPNILDLTQGLPLQLQSSCQNQNQILSCNNFPIETLNPGKYSLELQPISKSISQSGIKPGETKIEVIAKEMRIVSFTLNNSSVPNQVLNNGQQVILSWQVEGDDVNVELSPYGSVEKTGSKVLTANQALPSQITLTVADKYGQSPVKKGFSLTVNGASSSSNNSIVVPSVNVPKFSTER